MPESIQKSSDSRRLKICTTCRSEIKNQEFIISRNSSYHRQCFICQVCKANLANSSVYLKDSNQLVCQQCYGDGLDKCDRCSRELFSETYLKLDGSRKMHHSCVRCCHCNLALSDTFYESEGLFYCIDHYHNQFLFKCKFCQQFTVPNSQTEKVNYVTYLENKYHASCFLCDFCGHTLLANDDHSTMQFYQINHNKSCANCLNSAADERFRDKNTIKRTIKQINPTKLAAHLHKNPNCTAKSKHESSKTAKQTKKKAKAQKQQK